MAKRAAPRPLPRPARTAADTRRIMATLFVQHPNANTELNFSNAYELLVATILSAQCTDERVNKVTPALFKRYPTPRALAAATAAALEPQIQSTGFFRAKSRALLGMAQAVVNDHGGEVPTTMEKLVGLPGVGRKTANVVLGHAVGVPGLPVDRHVLRVANRIGIARSEDPEIVERQLCAAMAPERWTLTSDTLILHGRRICRPRPLCDRCSVRDDCRYYRTVVAKLAKKAKVKSVRRSERGSLSEVRRAAKPRGTARGRGAPSERSESGSLSEVRRGAQPGGTSRGGGAPSERSETGLLVDVRRAAKPRGTGRGGGAPRQTKE